MASQDQNIDHSRITNSSVQQVQAGRDAISFLNSHDNQVIIENTFLRLFGISESSQVDWDWGKLLLEKKELPEIRQRLTDTLGRDRIFMDVVIAEQPSWVNRSPLEADRRLQIDGEDCGILDPNKMLIETFGRDDIGGKLLILGAPGSGKTTALLSLAEQLVCGALAQPKTVIPVLFELSTWRDDKQSIHNWLIEQLYDLHGGNRKSKIYEKWLERQILLPLLDGLDELGLERQEKCTVKLNEFARNYPQMVVCCRVKEFETVNIKLRYLKGAVCLQPLADGQIEAYLHSIHRSELWSAMQTNPNLQALLKTTPEGDPGLLRVPLFVKLTADVYDPNEPIGSKKDLLEKYIERQLSFDQRERDRHKAIEKRKWAYKTVEAEPKLQETRIILRRLAKHMQSYKTVEFLIEEMQPDIWGDLRLCYLLIVTSILGLAFGLLLGLINKLDMIWVWAFAGMIWWIKLLFCGLLGGIKEIRLIETFQSFMSIKRTRQKISEKFFHMQISIRWIATSVIILIFFLPLMAWGHINYPNASGVFIEMLLIFVLSIMVFYSTNNLILNLILAILVQMISAIIFIIIANLNDDVVKVRSYPNQGIVNSLKNMLWTTFFVYPFGVISVMVVSLIRLLEEGVEKNYVGTHLINLILPDSLKVGWFVALLFGFFIGGGVTCVQHLCLRFILWKIGTIPWNFARFLNYCVERRLLLRVGGRYRFLHRELLDHFAQSGS